MLAGCLRVEEFGEIRESANRAIRIGLPNRHAASLRCGGVELNCSAWTVALAEELHWDMSAAEDYQHSEELVDASQQMLEP